MRLVDIAAQVETDHSFFVTSKETGNRLEVIGKNTTGSFSVRNLKTGRETNVRGDVDRYEVLEGVQAQQAQNRRAGLADLEARKTELEQTVEANENQIAALETANETLQTQIDELENQKFDLEEQF